MNYYAIYDNLITSRKNRLLSENEYYERHHIIPKCFGGSNNKDNIVHLTPREHFFAHLLLVKINTGLKRTKMVYALIRMCYPNNKSQTERRINSRKYNILKITNYISGESHYSYGKKLSKYEKEKISKRMSGERNHRYGKIPWNFNLTAQTDKRLIVSEKTKEKISKLSKGRRHSSQTKQKISETHKGKEKSETHRKKISETLKGRKLKDSTKQKMSNSRKNKKQKTLTCPHCNKSGGTTMHRWHFDNCKNKNI